MMQMTTLQLPTTPTTPTKNEPIPVLPSEQKFGSLTDALEELKYVDLPPQRPKTFTYTDAKKAMTVKWKTVKSDDSLGANTTPAVNILKHKPRPRQAAQRLRTPLDAFELYFTDEMLEKISTFTNASIKHLLENSYEKGRVR